MKDSGKVQRSRLQLKQRARLSLKRVALLASSAIVILTLGFILFISLSDSRKSFAYASGDFRSKASGNWNSTSTWEKYNGSAWAAATATPSSSDGTIYIQSGQTVTVTASVTVDQVDVLSGGYLTVSGGT